MAQKFKSDAIFNLRAPILAAAGAATAVLVLGLIMSAFSQKTPPPVIAQPAAEVTQPSNPPAETPLEKPLVETPAAPTILPPPPLQPVASEPAPMPMPPPATPETVATVTPPTVPPPEPAVVPSPTPTPLPIEIPQQPSIPPTAAPDPPGNEPGPPGNEPGPPGNEPGPPGNEPSPARNKTISDLPDEQALLAARAKILGVFGDEAKAATRPDEKRKLADKMSKLAEETLDDPAVRYVLYDNARKLYVGAGAVYQAHQAAQDLSSAFRMKAAANHDLILATYTALSEATLTDHQREQLQDMLGTSVAVHLREKEAKEADQCSLLRMKVVARLNDAELKRKASQQRSDVLKLKAEASATRAPVVRPDTKKRQSNVVVQSFDAVQMPAATDLTSNGGKLVCGWEFKTNAEMRVTHFGLFSKQPEGLFVSHTVAIWDLENRQPIAFTTIPAGDKAVADGLFRFVPINPVLLKANHHYAIVAHYSDNSDKTVSMMNPQQGSIEFSGHFEVIGNRHAFPRDKMAFPDQSELGVKRATIGPTFRYEALELR